MEMSFVDFVQSWTQYNTITQIYQNHRQKTLKSGIGEKTMDKSKKMTVSENGDFNRGIYNYEKT